MLLAAAAGLAGVALGGVSDEEAERLGRDLTPLGAERAGAAGIPEWSGGLSSPAVAGFPDYRPGEHLKDPYESEQPLFVISAANVDAYAAQLSAAHQALLRAYPDYRMPVYPSHRSAAAPEEVYRATRRNATTAHLVGAGEGIGGAFGGIPFPIPGSGLEVLWNHLARFRGAGVALATGQAAVNDLGVFTLVRFREEFYFPYYQPAMTPATFDNILYYFMQTAVVPARLNGEVLLVQQTLDQAREPRRAWVYVPGQRRVRRAPQGTYLSAELSGSNLRSADQFDMYSGSPAPYEWTLVGKRALYVPYNAYRLQSAALSYGDLLRAHHINPEYARYELHRVWVVDGVRRPGAHAPYSRRTLYVDEDSWQILIVDCYDDGGELYRVQEGHAISYYQVPALWTDLELVMDVKTGAYLATGLQSQEPRPTDFALRRLPADYEPNRLEWLGER
ncbi:MAG TPA: DUF1329 domain-containing protein [Steroidobacteraceae bacterium]|nr:DUF1329 domain-containing protein [Steroidobacteraceae bacterium]